MNAIVWHREDLRLTDNPALFHANKEGYQVLPLYLLDEVEDTRGAASKAFLHHSITELSNQYNRLNAKLNLQKGEALSTLKKLIKAHDIKKVFWNRCYTKEQIARDSHIKKELQKIGVEVESFNGKLWHEPWEIKNKQGNFFKVFTPYWKTVRQLNKKQPYPAPEQLKGILSESLLIDDLNLLPKINWHQPMLKGWPATEAQAHLLLDEFLNSNIRNYAKGRDIPALESVSKLSPYLALGLISPNQIYQKVQDHLLFSPEHEKEAEKFLSEICWREFSYHILYHFPDLKTTNWQNMFDAYPWEENNDTLNAWKKGKTGYPIVDAGMRELWQTGYMHNRVRMIVASFLIKDLFIDWRIGEAWFWDCLIDADAASNAASWQWVAGSGFDASPYFRVFNPTTQGEKFDPEGIYIRKWLPELKNLDNAFIHNPSKASAFDLKLANIDLGKDYPYPIVEHSNAREKALSIYKELKQKKAP